MPKKVKKTGPIGRENAERRLEAMEKTLAEIRDEQHSFDSFEKKAEAVVERKVYEIRAISYITLVISSVLLALMLGMVINALGFRL